MQNIDKFIGGESAHRELAKRLGISEMFLTLLEKRGIREDELADFLHPSLDKMHAPLSIKNMDKAVFALKNAIKENKKIVIYGDYDCDGICAVAILMLYLRDKARVSYFIPDRKRDGYGISVGALDRIIARDNPNLIISVDCGITAASEAEYLKRKGIEFIVTDHHEPQEKLPDCVVVDPKIEKTGFYELCGAGVALKLVEAMAGAQEARKYLDIAAIATLADVVPLSEDNRIIAYFGIQQLKKTPRKGIKMLLGEDEATSQNIMFRLAPRMNAAGRLGSASKVVGLFLEDDYFMLRSLADELARDNQRRQQLCEDVVREAMEMLSNVDFSDTPSILLYCKGWEAGVLGIAAARLAEEFDRPAILFTDADGMYKGSARSVEGVNIFELLCDLKDYLESFGGHAQAAGVNVLPNRFEDFKRAMQDELRARAQATDKKKRYDLALPLDMDFLSFATELEKLEPTGYGNPKPVFLIESEGMKFESIGFSNHMKYTSENLDILGFSSYAEALYARTGRTDFEITLDINCFRNNLKAQGIIKSLSHKSINLTPDEARSLNVHQLGVEGGNPSVENISAFEASKKLSDLDGVLFVCFSKEDYDRLVSSVEGADRLPVYVGAFPTLNPKNSVIICPNKGFEYCYFSEVIIAGSPLCDSYFAYINSKSKRVYRLFDVPTDCLKISDNELRALYVEIGKISQGLKRPQNMHSLYKMVCEKKPVSESVFLASLALFEELGLVHVGDRGLIEVSRKPVRLENSVIYRNLSH